MNQRRKPSRGPRPAMGPKQSKHYWHNRRCWPDWDYWDHDYDWDYDYDLDWDHNLYYTVPRRAKAPTPVKAWDEGTGSDVIMTYQQGFKDGWYAAFEYMSMYGTGRPMPEPAPEPKPPVSPTEDPASKDGKD